MYSLGISCVCVFYFVYLFFSWSLVWLKKWMNFSLTLADEIMGRKKKSRNWEKKSLVTLSLWFLISDLLSCGQWTYILKYNSLPKCHVFLPIFRLRHPVSKERIMRSIPLGCIEISAVKNCDLEDELYSQLAQLWFRVKLLQRSPASSHSCDLEWSCCSCRQPAQLWSPYLRQTWKSLRRHFFHKKVCVGPSLQSYKFMSV